LGKNCENTNKSFPSPSNRPRVTEANEFPTKYNAHSTPFITPTKCTVLINTNIIYNSFPAANVS